MRKWAWVLLAVLSLVVVAGVVSTFIFGPDLNREARDRIQQYLEDRFHSDVQITDLHLAFFPRPRVTLEGVTLRLHGRTDVPPLIEISSASFGANWTGLLGRTATIHEVVVDRLQLRIPPKESGKPRMFQGGNGNLAEKHPVIIEEIRANETSLIFLPKPQDSAKPPRLFEIHQLVMRDFAFDRPASFQAVLTNPKPRGDIQTGGQFGPWVADDPGQTPATGAYTFSHADLGTLKGLSGTLSSQGHFSGPLDYLDVEGQTDTPDFALRVSAHPMALHTDFSATVDGTNGNTYLKSVTAKFLHTTLRTNGEIVDLNKRIKSRTIRLHASSDKARIEDLLLLAVKNLPPAMTGSARIAADIDIPEEDEDLIDRMKISGKFSVAQIHFTNEDTQGKVDSLSRRGQGEPRNHDIDGQASNLEGAFEMNQALIRLSDLAFSVSGADVDLGGTYNMDGGQLDFVGKLRLQAKLSQTTTGVKSFLLKAVDPFFSKRNAGTEVPIKITGTKDHPSFGLDFHDPNNKK